MTPEGRVKKQVTAMLKELGDRGWFFMPVQRGFGKPALDYIGCAGGWFVAIETKKDAKTPLTIMQNKTKKDMEQAGGLVYIIYDTPTLHHAREELFHLASDPPVKRFNYQ